MRDPQFGLSAWRFVVAFGAHWPGTDDGFAALTRLTGLRPPAT